MFSIRYINGNRKFTLLYRSWRYEEKQKEGKRKKRGRRRKRKKQTRKEKAAERLEKNSNIKQDSLQTVLQFLQAWHTGPSVSPDKAAHKTFGSCE